MSNPDHPTLEKEAESPAPTAPPVASDIENQTPVIRYGVTAIEKRWSREELLTKVSMGLRGSGCLFSFLAFVIMASNNHGDNEDFNEYEQYRYVLAMAIISMVYTGVQAVRQFVELYTGKQWLSTASLQWINFCGDQILAYLLISATSSAIPLTDSMKFSTDYDPVFIESSAAAISMEFLAFLVLAVSALISGYQLSHQSYI
ncbi:hypothetical protein F0562_015185 [Nyssa sinensis]|uniref:CASP-like protein n=1 Tax=Nyssa sinensis TaxID=561372 RepID=A0A5J4ZKF0_9ASTE|nr:hypothetical protein F0562_015185 [Nyssa sinensis]